VNVSLCTASEAIKKISDELGLEISDDGYVNLIIDDVGNAAGEIHRSDGKRLVHCHYEIACAQNTFLISEGQGKGIPQRDSNILNGVMLVDVEVADTIELKVEAAVTRKELQHMVEKADACRDRVGTLSIDVEAQ
jgi:copper chaperone CopZ